MLGGRPGGPAAQRPWMTDGLSSGGRVEQGCWEQGYGGGAQEAMSALAGGAEGTMILNSESLVALTSWTGGRLPRPAPLHACPQQKGPP